MQAMPYIFVINYKEYFQMFQYTCRNIQFFQIDALEKYMKRLIHIWRFIHQLEMNKGAQKKWLWQNEWGVSIAT